MLDAISEHMARRIAQMVIAELAPVVQPKPVEHGQIVGVAALARYLECGKDRVYALMRDPEFPKPRMVGERRVWSKADMGGWK